MSADADLRRATAHCLRTTAALLVLSAAAAVAEARLDTPSSGALQLVQLNAGAGHAPVQLKFNVAAIQGIAGQEIPIRIELPQILEMATAEARQAFVLIRNIPPGVRLTTGMANGRLWVLSLKDLEGPRLIAQPGVTGSFNLEFNLIGPNNVRLAQQSVPLDLVSPDIAGRVPTTGALAALEDLPREQRTPRAPRPTSKLPLEEEAVLLERGTELVRQGGIAAARIIFEELAQKGSAQGALALARSFDPAYMPPPRISALAPDIDKALTWYRRAEELGSDEARARLTEIASGQK
jgi:hypothetical protein